MTCTPMSLVWSAAPPPLGDVLPARSAWPNKSEDGGGWGWPRERGKALISEATFGKQQPSPHFLEIT